MNTGKILIEHGYRYPMNSTQGPHVDQVQLLRREACIVKTTEEMGASERVKKKVQVEARLVYDVYEQNN